MSPSLEFLIRRPDAARLRYRVVETRKRARDMKAGFRKAEPKVHRAVRRWFDSEGEGGWVGLARSTIEARANRWGYYKRGFREGPTHKILHARHDLVRSLTKRGGKNLSRITKRTWSYGSSDRKAAIHHRGGRSGVRPLPRRAVVPPGRLPKIVGEELREHVLFPWRQSYGSS